MQNSYENCMICPRNCKVNRTKGMTGVCGETNQLRAARAALHYWEEPCISGRSGSGAVFFSGCSLGCVYCQNQSISHENLGYPLSAAQLAEIFLRLQEEGANNINLVTPTHFVPSVRDALIFAKKQGLCVPVVYNTGGYEKTETLRLLEGLVDIYLPDCKYFSGELSGRYSRCPDYFPVAADAIAEMIRQVGSPLFSGDPDEDDYTDENLLKKGVIVRHLLLPGCVEDSMQVLSHLHKRFGRQIYFSLMSQYTALPHVASYPELDRSVTKAEYESLVQYAISIGIDQAFIQEDGVDQDSFIPEFNGKGIL